MKNFVLGDCMDYLKDFSDNYFDLAIVDPPYGGGGKADAEETFNGAVQGRFGGRFEKYIKPITAERTGGAWAKKYGNVIEHWDIAPTSEYFEELFRVSKNQIIWGGNYFGLPPTRCFIIWRKTNIPTEGFTMSPVEYAWTSFNRNAEMIEVQSSGTTKNPRFHPTQKPVMLYKEVLNKFAKKGDKILDTHVGSASSLIACEDMGYDYVGYEINPHYYDLAQKRLEEFNSQVRWQL